MSHFTKQKVSYTDAECLVVALGVLGFEAEACKERKVRDYTGAATDQIANVIVKREKLGAHTADMGFYVDKTGKESQSFVDEYQNTHVAKLGGVNALCASISQEYGVAVISKTARAKGKVPHRVVGKDGKAYVFVGA